MNGGGRLVLICARTCRTMLVDKGKALAGDKVRRTDEHGSKDTTGENGMCMNERIRVLI